MPQLHITGSCISEQSVILLLVKAIHFISRLREPAKGCDLKLSGD